MSFTEAIYYIQGHHEKKHLKKAEETLANHIRSINKDKHEEIAICKYFLLSAKLQYGLAFETDEEKRIYCEMIENFKRRKKVLEKALKKEKSQFQLSQLLAFLKMLEGYFANLHFLYDKHDFLEALDKIHKEKMDLRLTKFWYEKKYMKWLFYFILRTSSLYGTSFVRWFITISVTISTFGFLFYLTDPHLHMINHPDRSILDYFYFSTVTITTLGYGDITPINDTQKILAATEAVFGYLQLGILLTLIQRKL